MLCLEGQTGFPSEWIKARLEKQIVKRTTKGSTTQDFQLDDPQLAEKIRASDPETLQHVVRAYARQIFRAARGSGLDVAGAEDVTQATFLTFIERAQHFEGRSHVRTWLFGILYNKVAETRRKLKKERQTEEIDSVIEQRFNNHGKWARPPQSVDSALHSAEVTRFVDECLGLLSTQQRMAFVLREVEELATHEICNVLGVTRTNLGVLLYRARNHLRECLEKKGVRGSTFVTL